MINYKSFADLSSDISKNLYRIPDDVDLIVGIPRSGLMAGVVLALNLNLKICDLDQFLNNYLLTTGQTRKSRNNIDYPWDAKKILIFDDSIYSGQSMRNVKKKIDSVSFNGEIIYGVVYGCEPGMIDVDICFQKLDAPRVFQWNVFHRDVLENCCVDIDGVLCLDPTHEQNDDGEKYKLFLENAIPLAKPTYTIGALVTSRLEKYRPQTESWLRKHGINYKQLFMLDMESAEERKRLGCHSSFKSQIFSSLKESILFIESDPNQAVEIASNTGKPVLDFSSQLFVLSQGKVYMLNQIRKNYFNFHNRILFKLKNKLRR